MGVLNENHYYYPEELTEYIRNIDPRYENIHSCKLGFLTQIIYVNFFKPSRFMHSSGDGFFIHSESAKKILGKFYNYLLEPIVIRDNHYKMDAGECKKAKLSPQAYHAVLEYLEKLSKDHLTNYRKKLNISGKVASRDIYGRKAKARFQLHPVIPGRSEDVFQLICYLGECIDFLSGWCDKPDEEQAFRFLNKYDINPFENAELLIELRDQAKIVVDLSNARYYPSNGYPSMPLETGTGRIIYYEPSLQNTRRVIRDCYLGGAWDIDINAAHTTFALHAANKHGLSVEALDYYVHNKDEIRDKISIQTSISKETVKMAILAISYGAKLQNNDDCAINKRIKKAEAGNTKQLTDKLFSNEIFARIASDLKKARHAVINEFLSECSDPRHGYLVNAVGKPVKKDKNIKTLSAHALQGLEAMFLHICYEHLNTDILLMMHDGIVTSREINTKPIIADFLKKTGISITLEQKQIPMISQV